MPEQQPSFVDLPYIAPTMPLDPVSTLNKDVGGPGSFSELLVGAGAKAFHADSSGWWQGAVKFADAPARCDMDGNAVFNSITINGRSGATIAGAIDADGNFIHELISTNFNTQTKQILGSFTFGVSGAIAIATDASNGLWLSPTGLLGKKAGATTFAIDTGGNATFGGALVAATGTLGSVTAGTFTGCVFQTAASGAKLTIDGNNLNYHDGSDTTFNVSFINSSGWGDAGDVRIGKIASGKYIYWDNSAGSLEIYGLVSSNSGSYRVVLDPSTRKLSFMQDTTEKGKVYCDASYNMFIGTTDKVVLGNLSGTGYITFNISGSEMDMEMATNAELKWNGGRLIRGTSSAIEISGNLNPTSADAYNLGEYGSKWKEVWAGKIFQSTPDTGNRSVFDFAYVEMGLLPKKMQEKYLKGENGCMRVDGVPQDEIKLPFEKGSVLIWKNGKLQESEKEEDPRAVAIANNRGLPIVLGAEPVRVIGKVSCGDYIVSAKNGLGKAAKNPDIRKIIGTALEGSNNQKEKLIQVMIKF